jgi:hypothetical protein
VKGGGGGEGVMMVQKESAGVEGLLKACCTQWQCVGSAVAAGCM